MSDEERYESIVAGAVGEPPTITERNGDLGALRPMRGGTFRPLPLTVPEFVTIHATVSKWKSDPSVVPYADVKGVVLHLIGGDVWFGQGNRLRLVMLVPTPGKTGPGPMVWKTIFDEVVPKSALAYALNALGIAYSGA